MTREKMMMKIQDRLTAGESVSVNVAHSGKWSGVDVYLITKSSIEHTGHKWGSFGTLRSTYASIVLGR